MGPMLWVYDHFKYLLTFLVWSTYYHEFSCDVFMSTNINYILKRIFVENGYNEMVQSNGNAYVYECKCA